MKKYCLIFLVLLLTSCSSNNSSKTTITWAVGRDATGAQNELVKIFMEKNPQYIVKTIEMPGSATTQRDTYVTYLSARDDSIDVYALDIIWPAEFAAANWLYPLDDYINANEKDKFLNGPLKGCTYNNALYALPWFTDAGVLYYRKDLVKKVPETWNELIKQASEISAKNKINGFVFQAKQYEGLICNYLEYLWSHGGKIRKKDNSINIESKEAKEALKLMHDMIYKNGVVPKGVLTYQEEESRQVFTSGQAVFLRNWPYVWTIAQDKEKSKVAGKIGIAPLPGTVKGRGASALGGWNLGISKYTKNPEAAWEFIKFMTSFDAQKMYAINGGRLPTRKAVYKDTDVLKAAPHYRDFYSVFVRSRPRPSGTNYAEISDMLQIELHRALTNQQSINEALNKAQSKVERLIKEKN